MVINASDVLLKGGKRDVDLSDSVDSGSIAGQELPFELPFAPYSSNTYFVAVESPLFISLDWPNSAKGNKSPMLNMSLHRQFAYAYFGE